MFWQVTARNMTLASRWLTQQLVIWIWRLWNITAIHLLLPYNPHIETAQHTKQMHTRTDAYNEYYTCIHTHCCLKMVFHSNSAIILIVLCVTIVVIYIKLVTQTYNPVQSAHKILLIVPAVISLIKLHNGKKSVDHCNREIPHRMAEFISRIQTNLKTIS